MSKIAKKRMNESEYPNTKRSKKDHSKKEEIIEFDSINKLIIDTYPKIDTKNLELIKFLTIFDILFEKANKNNQAIKSKEEQTEEIDSVDGLPEIIKIVCKTLLHILSESLHEIKLPLNIKKILIKLKKLLKITENGEDKIKSKKTSSSSSSSSESTSESTPIAFSNRSEKTSSSSEKTSSS